MEYIKSQDYEYIKNKYHDSSKPWYGHDRFIRRDQLFSAETGMAPEQILAQLTLRDAQRAGESHPVRKAHALSFVLKNTRISCDPRDIFPTINMVDRPLRKILIEKWKKEIFTDLIPEVEAKRAQLERDGIVTMWLDYDHSVPVWERIFSLGFEGILRESKAARADRSLSSEQEEFFEGIRITYEGVLEFLERLYALANNTPGSEKMAAALKNIRHRPPSTFYETLLTVYLYFMISEHIDCLQVRSLSNFDRLFYPFYKNDLENGVCEEQIRADLAYFLMQFAAIGNYWNQPIFLGGENADGTTVINELSYLLLDVYDKMELFNPKLQIKVSDSTPKEFLLRALDMIRHGHNSIVFLCDNTMRKELMRMGATADEARLCNVTGCYEYSIQGSYGTGMNYSNLLKPLEYTLHEGRDGVTGVPAGLPCPSASEYESFDALYTEYKRQLKHLIDITTALNNSYEGYLYRINPLSFLSATFPSCIERARDAIGGGALMNSTTMEFGFIADLADSLTMLQKYVFDKKELTLPEFVDMIDRNFEGNENFLAKLRADREKYGNNKDRPDSFATDIVNFIVEALKDRPNNEKRGGKWGCSFHVARMSYTQGKLTASSPNGRLYGEELSKNLSASMGQNREGATAAILSATKIDATKILCDAALDLGLLPSAVRGEDGLEAMYGLLMTFCKRGGHALHINVFDADTLRDAQAHPEKYQDLQIRVCGWNVLWNNINKEEQDGFIRQAEALI